MDHQLFQNFITVAGQVAVVFIIIALGWFSGKTNMLSREACEGMASITVNIVTPALILMAFQREFESHLMQGFLLNLAGVVACYLVSLALGWTVFRRQSAGRRGVLAVSCAFGNLGMMALPLQEGLFGSEGVFYSAAGMGMFQLVFWSLGLVAITGRAESRSVMLKNLFNPGLIAAVVGLVLFYGSVTLPAVPTRVMNSLAGLNMPLCMLIIGYRLSGMPLASLFREKAVWASAVLRLVLLPMLVTLALYGLGFRGVAAVCLVIAAAAPVAASVNIVALTYKREADLAARVTSMQTLLSMLTMPLVILFAYAFLM